MAKNPKNKPPPISVEFSLLRNELLSNTFKTRSELMKRAIDPSRDIDAACGYPAEVTVQDYDLLYKKEGIARRVVTLYPEESWKQYPEVLEDENPDETEWEKKWKTLVKKHNIYSYLQRADEMSGIGQFGILLIGINDGKLLNEPVDGIDPVTGKTSEKPKEHALLYLRPLDEGVIEIKSTEKNPTSPRFGQPVMYSVTFEDSDNQTAMLIHWTRVLHVADNRQRSETKGQPRMESVFNRLYDLRKILGGSGEMFWKGGFPGYSLELMPGFEDATVDKAAIKTELELFQNEMQRFMVLEGLTVKSLAMQVADPKGHFETNIKAICISLKCPYRIFMGTEEAKLAGEQDGKNWDARIEGRQNNYVIPFVLNAFIERLMDLGIIERIEYISKFPPLGTPSEKDKAEVAEKLARSLAAYMQSDAALIIPPELFLTMIMKFTTEEAKAIMEEAVKYQNTIEDDPEIDDEEVE